MRTLGDHDPTASSAAFWDDVPEQADLDHGEARAHGPIVRRLLAITALVVLAAGVLIGVTRSSVAGADPSANDWYRLRLCESSNNYATNTGNGHYGAYQFDLPTWQSVGGTGYPYLASPAEQDARALKLYRMRGWQPWQCATILGLREDADARSHRYDDIVFPGGGGVPAWPGSRLYSRGDANSTIARWQAQMHTRGAASLHGSGVFGSNTLTVVKRIQGQNGLPQTGLLGPNTWALAWTGTYRDSGTSTGSGRAPAFPGTRYWSYGDTSDVIARWQAQMHTRGAALVGTGHFGPNTLAAVQRIQGLNGLPQTGLLGPVTWKLAWTGRY